MGLLATNRHVRVFLHARQAMEGLCIGCDAGQTSKFGDDAMTMTDTGMDALRSMVVRF